MSSIEVSTSEGKVLEAGKDSKQNIIDLTTKTEEQLEVKDKEPSPSPEAKEAKSKRKKRSKSSTPAVDDSNGLKEGETYALSYEEVNDNKEEISEIRGSGRYFGVNDPDLSQPICSNCHRRGHIRVNCKVVVCHACGKIDDHYETQCPNSMVCSNCGQRGHFKNNCKERIKRNYCSDCDSRYHSLDRCPNIWRSYITIETKDSNNKSSVVGYPFNFIYCYNCAAKGHYGDECKLPRTSKTPNINGSAFTGDNLPGKLKNMYHENLRKYEEENDDEDDIYGYGSNRWNGSSQPYYGNNVSFSRNNGNLPNRPLKRKFESDSGYNSTGTYNRVPPPSHLQPKKSGTLKSSSNTPRGPSGGNSNGKGPSKTGFLPLNKRSYGSSSNNYHNSKNEVYSFPRGGGNGENHNHNNGGYNSKRSSGKSYSDSSSYRKSNNGGSRGGSRGYNNNSNNGGGRYNNRR